VKQTPSNVITKLYVFLLSKQPRFTHPPYQWIMWAVSLGVKRLECVADYSPLSSAEVKNEWSYNSGPTHAFIPCRGTTL